MTSFLGGVIRLRLLILAAALGVLAVGIVQLRGTAPVDVLPEFTPPYAEIQTEALGLSAEEVEQLITVPLEADLLNGVQGVEVIRSESVPGLSSIVLVFERGSDVYQARQLVEERLTQAHALPNVSKPPTLLQPLSSSNRVLMIGLSSTELTPIEQSVIARWTVRPRLMGVSGRRQHLGLGDARPAAAGAGRSGAAPRPQGDAEPGDQHRRQRAGRLAADLPGGVHSRHGRLHRDSPAASAGAPPAGEDRRSGRAGPGSRRGRRSPAR